MYQKIMTDCTPLLANEKNNFYRENGNKLSSSIVRKSLEGVYHAVTVYPSWT